ncbi:hypothetical protein [Aquimarina aggregata]|uniref:hypothetical protein n=1 Tax=Aquimarina aggregata TaxID=1642818 RepID=UPI002492566F|nr:hypothetical protein [Aquimarina aggregata]
MPKKITYQDKTNKLPIIDAVSQATAEDFNHIKEVVNDHADAIDKKLDFVSVPRVIDDLTTALSNAALSANQGFILKNIINNILAIISSDDMNLDEVQEIVNFIKQNKEEIEKLTLDSVLSNGNVTDKGIVLRPPNGVVENPPQDSVKIYNRNGETGQLDFEGNFKSFVNVGNDTGTFTPLLFGGGSGITYDVTFSTGNYIKSGDLFRFNFRISGISSSGSPTAIMTIGGFPFRPKYIEFINFNIVNATIKNGPIPIGIELVGLQTYTTSSFSQLIFNVRGKDTNAIRMSFENGNGNISGSGSFIIR